MHTAKWGSELWGLVAVQPMVGWLNCHIWVAWPLIFHFPALGVRSHYMLYNWESKIKKKW